MIRRLTTTPDGTVTAVQAADLDQLEREHALLAIVASRAQCFIDLIGDGGAAPRISRGLLVAALDELPIDLLGLELAS